MTPWGTGAPSRTVLVTGAAGFIGRPLVSKLAAAGDTVVALDQHQPDRAALRPTDTSRIHPVIGDITNTDLLSTLLAQYRVSHVVHGAAVVGVRASADGPRAAATVNVLGALALWEACAAAGSVERVLDLSSEEYYGDFTTDPVSEDASACPTSPYGVTKFAAERLGNWYADVQGLPYVAARLSWVYGPGFPRQRLPSTWVADLVAGRPSELARGGDQLLDLTFIDDAVAGLVTLVEAPALAHRAYNVATGNAIAVRDLAGALRAIEPTWDVVLGDGPLELAPGVSANVKGALDCSRIRRETEWCPRIGLDAGLRRLVEEERRTTCAR